MKKLKRPVAILSAILLMLQGNLSEAVSFEGMDYRNADAGASYLLKKYMESNENASEKLVKALEPLAVIDAERETEDGEELSRESSPEEIYESPITGIVCVESSLNVRSSPTVLSEVVAKVYRNEEVEVIGCKLANGRLWNKVQIEEGVAGYCYSDYIKYGDDAAVYYAELHEIEKQAAEVPESLTVYEDPEEYGVSEEDLKDLQEYVKQINYTLANDYPEKESSGEYMNMYAILIYLLEYYQQVKDIAVKYDMEELQAQCNIDMYTFNLTRETLQDTTGQSDEEIQADIEAAREERRKSDSHYIGVSIADYAATFVGTLPYVWGGASLKSGADCSGFCAQIYAHFGYIDQGMANVHGYDSTSLRSVGYAVSVDEIMPGDLVCYRGHVAIYYGNGMVVHEPSVGKKCSFGYLYMMPIVCVRRLH